MELNPFDAQYHLRLGWEYAHLWNEKDYHHEMAAGGGYFHGPGGLFCRGEESAPASGAGELLDYAEQVGDAQ